MIVRRLAVAILATLVSASCTPVNDTEAIDSVLATAAESGRFPGLIAMAATADAIVYRGAAGRRDLASNAPMTIDTIVQIASMTKPVRSVAVMQLVEAGTIGLDQPIGNYVARLADVQVLDGFDAEDKAILRAPHSPVTVRQLLSHTSGYVYEIWNRDAARHVALGGAASFFAGGDSFIDAPLAFDPGTSWEYGISTDILGILVETVSGQPLDTYFKTRIFAPLGMRDTGFRVPAEKEERLATVYSRMADGSLIAIPYSKFDGGFLSGGAGLSSTAGDYIRFLRALLRGGELDGVRILRADTVDLMAQNQIGDLEAAHSVVTLMPEFSNDFDFIPDSEDKFGLGFLINGSPVPGGRSPGSLAWGGIYNTYFWIDQERDVCGVLMTQILPFYDADSVRLLGQFERGVYSLPAVAGE